MKVLSSKPETQASASLNQDPSAAPLSPTDFLFSFMLQASVEPESQAEPTETLPTSDLTQDEKKDFDQIKQLAEQNNANNNALLLEQLNTMRIMSNNQPPLNPNPNPDMKPAESVAPSSTPNVKNNVVQSAQAKQAAAAALLLKQQANQNQNQINNAVMAEKPSGDKPASDLALTSVVAEQLNTSTKPADNKKLNDMRQIMAASHTVTDTVDAKDAKLVAGDQLKQILSAALPASDADESFDDKFMEKLTKQKLADNNIPAPVAQKPHDAALPRTTMIEQTATAALATADVQIRTSSEPTQQPHKYVDAFTQLGQIISAQAMHVMRNNEQILPANLRTEQVHYFQNLGKSHVPEGEVKVELFTSSIDALNKETYDAKIKIHPPELGHVTAKLKVDKGHAELVILTETVRAKEIVELNLPRLRENFQNSDINLTSVQVQASQSGAKDQSGQNSQHSDAFPIIESTNELNQQGLSPKEESSKGSDTIIDTYA